MVRTHSPVRPDTEVGFIRRYWQAFVEKHHYYHNHLNSATEDPESKEYDEKQMSVITTKVYDAIRCNTFQI